MCELSTNGNFTTPVNGDESPLTQTLTRTGTVGRLHPGTAHPSITQRGQGATAVATQDAVTRDPDDWVARLKGDMAQRDQALAQLREILLRGLSKPMASRFGGAISAEDVVQEALVKILASLDQFAGRSRFTTWAMTIANRIGISAMRRKHFQDVSIESFRTDDSAIQLAREGDVTLSAEFDRQSMVYKLQSLIDSTLSEKQRFVIRATLAGLPVEVIAEKSGSNRNSVYKMVHDARSKLKTGLEAAGISAEALAATFA